MGRKITIDSSTLVNKGLEAMEAKWLFDVDMDHIQVVVQPQSIIHSAVEFVDGAVIAQLGTPDMKLPIQYAIYYPERRCIDNEPLNLFEIGSLTFEKPDLDVFEGLKLAYKAGDIGGSMPTVFNAANEKAVALFLNRQIEFLDIVDIIKECMDKHQTINNPTLDEILECENKTYKMVEELIKK
jgi:1-deoxy-D-xylulose-5-phosphate reductoisomerase